MTVEAGSVGVLILQAIPLGERFHIAEHSALGHVPFVILLGAKHAKDHNVRSDDLVKNLVGKPAKKDSAEVPIVRALAFGIEFQRSHGGRKFIQEFVAQARDFLLVPCSRRGQILLRLRPNEHQRNSCAFTQARFDLAPRSTGRGIGVVIRLSFIEQRAFTFSRPGRFFQPPELL
jgi:hypothetical protein